MDHLLHLHSEDGKQNRLNTCRYAGGTNIAIGQGTDRAPLGPCCLVTADPTERVLWPPRPHGLVAQLEEHPVCNRKAPGSNPGESIPSGTWTSSRKGAEIRNIRNRTAGHPSRAESPRLPA